MGTPGNLADVEMRDSHSLGLTSQARDIGMSGLQPT
jgi:hypothetical protein